MAGRDRRQDGGYGFTREPETHCVQPRTSVRPVQAKKDEPPVLSAHSLKAAQRPSTSQPRPASTNRVSDDDHWVVREKKRRSIKRRAPSAPLNARHIDMPAFIEGGPATPPIHESDGRSKRWLALGLAGLIYAVGFAGIWSMTARFEPRLPSSITPAGDEGILPPLDDAVDVRDARSKSLILPERRPATDGAAGTEITASNLHRKS